MAVLWMGGVSLLDGHYRHFVWDALFMRPATQP
jgi:hypothetical protein